MLPGLFCLTLAVITILSEMGPERFRSDDRMVQNNAAFDRSYLNDHNIGPLPLEFHSSDGIQSLEIWKGWLRRPSK